MPPARRRRATKRPSKKFVRKGLRRVRKASPTVHKFKELTEIPALACASATISSGVISSNLNQIGNVVAFKNMFDLYKITGMKVKIMPKFNQADVTSGGLLPQLYLATNRDPFTPAPTGVPDILNDDTCRVYRLDRPVSWYVHAPKPDMSSSFTIADTRYVVPQQWQFGPSTKMQPWLTTGGNLQSIDQSGVNHFGVRWVIDNTSGTVPIALNVYITLYFQCKEQD